MLFDKKTISINETLLFGKLFCDYINKHENLNSFYDYYFDEQSISNYLQKNNFENIDRKILVEVLQNQAEKVLNTSSLSKENIQLLKNNNCYTVTTGHQLCLFTGPLYFIYKIISTINHCETLKTKFPDKNFVPVYWMASEDNDFEEINHANVYGKKIVWNATQTGCVGDFNTEGLQNTIEELKNVIGDNEHATNLIELFTKAYCNHKNLSEATRYLVNELFGKYGLVILDGNDALLKNLFKTEFIKDSFENLSYKSVNKSAEKLKEKGYDIQVNPREINIFYKEKNTRERIEKKNNEFVVINTEIKFSEKEFLQLIETNTEKLSPNVVLRPLYQQKILPNIAYVGGPGELAYWLEYKLMFEAYNINFPILIPRDFVLLIDNGVQNKLQKLQLEISDIFKDGDELVKKIIKTQHNDINLEYAKNQINDLYNSILQTVSAIDKTIVGTTEAEKQKSINGLANIEQKINRALKQKSENDVNQIWSIKEKLFPKQIPQERYDNFSMYYTKYGIGFIHELIKHLTNNLNSFSYTILLEAKEK